MKNSKKLTLGLGLLIVTTGLLFGVAKPHKALATPLGVTLGNDFKFVDAADITGTVNGSIVTFYDDNVSDNNKASGANYQPQGLDSATFCNSGKWGITLKKPLSNAASQTGTIILGYKLGQNCSQIPDSSISPSATITISNPSNAAASQYKYDGNGNIVSVNGTDTFAQANGDASAYINTSGNGCSTKGVIITSGANGGVLYNLRIGDGSGLPAAVKALIKNSGTCGLASQENITIAGTPGSGGGNNPPGTVSPDDSCEAGYTGAGAVLNWVLCPILSGMDSIFGTINKQVEDQLNICTGQSSTITDPSAPGYSCKNNLLNDQVKKSWAIFRDLATALLVIIMLVMVFSQAISIGPFDAYTVRKILPKMIAAVILMQISWYLFKYMIDLSNDVGKGIQSLMLAPFGGTGSLEFDNLIAQAGSIAPSLATVGLFTALAVGTVLSGLTIMGVAFIGATAILSVIVGLLVLLFRQMLIIMAMILAPLALVAWILPGTQKYWKLWWDNFTKLLLMFPMIMAMIAAGKIFAKVGVDTGTGIFGVIIVFVGFLGPLWFLPKTFRWGGQAFAAASNGVMNGTKQLRGSPGKYALAGAKENRQFRAEERLGRLAEGRSRFRRVDELLAGRYNLARSGENRERHFESERAKGREAAEKAVAAQVIGSRFERQTHAEKLNDLNAVAQGEAAPHSGISGESPVAQRWALDKLAEYGDWDIVSNLRSQGRISREVWEAFVAKNISAIHQKAPHLSPLKPDLTGLSAEEIPSFHSYTMNELEEQATHGVVRNAATGMMERSAEPEEQRRRAVGLAARALDTPQISSRLTAEQRTSLERIRNLGGTEMMFARNPNDAAEVQRAQRARQNYGQQIASGNLSPIDQDIFEDNVLHLKSQAGTSREAHTAYNQIVIAIDQGLAERVKGIERGAVGRGLTPAQVATEIAAAEAAARAERSRLTTKGLAPLP